MNYSDEQIASITKIFVNSEITKKKLEPVQEAIRLGYGLQLFQEIIKSFNEDALTNEIATTNLMSYLEKIAEKNAAVAIYLMTKLWVVASSLYMHHVCDSIDLWIENESDAESIEFIKLGENENGNSNMKSKYLEWLSK